MFYVMAAEKKKVMLIIRNTFIIINMINLIIMIKTISKVDLLAGVLHLFLPSQLHQCCGARANN